MRRGEWFAGRPLRVHEPFEERNTGAISRAVYKTYLHAGNGEIIVPLLIFSLVFIQASTVMSSYWLVYWQEEKWREPVGFYVRGFIFFILPRDVLT